MQTGTKSVDEYTTVVNETTQLSDGRYVASDFLYIYNRVEVSGDVHLILADNGDLTVSGDISGSNLSIYAQSTGDNAGKLSANNMCCGTDGTFGGNGSNGGTITAAGGDSANAFSNTPTLDSNMKWKVSGARAKLRFRA